MEVSPAYAYAGFKNCKKQELGSSNDNNNAYAQQVCVVAQSEINVEPDLFKLYLVIRAMKTNIQDAKNSVVRRLDYVHQTLQNLDIKVADAKVTKILEKQEGGFQYKADILVLFSDYAKAQKASNIFTEKLNGNVEMDPLVFHHSPAIMDAHRRKAALNAFANARRKAVDLAAVGQSNLGKVLFVTEEEVSESKGYHGQEKALQHCMEANTISIRVKLRVSFALHGRKEN